jgi:Tol biopolymer transport system component
MEAPFAGNAGSRATGTRAARCRLILAIFGLSGLVLLAPALRPTPAAGAFPGENGVVVFSSNAPHRTDCAPYDCGEGGPRPTTECDYEIYSTDPASPTPQLTPLTVNRSRLKHNAMKADREPSVSSDGEKIVFSRWPMDDRSAKKTGDADLWIMNSDGSNQTRLTSGPGDDREPTFSPDGKRVAFSSTRAGAPRIYVRNAEPGGGADRLTMPEIRGIAEQELRVQSPSWSPDGKRIMATGIISLFRTTVVEDRRAVLFELNPSLGPPLSDGRVVANYENSSYAPSGEHFAAQSAGETSNIWRFENSPTAVPLRVTDLRDREAYQYTEPAYSPDGRQIVAVYGKERSSTELRTFSSDRSPITASGRGFGNGWFVREVLIPLHDRIYPDKHPVCSRHGEDPPFMNLDPDWAPAITP